MLECVFLHYFDMKCALDMHVYSLVCVLYWFMCVFMCVGILVRNLAVMCTRLSGFHVSYFICISGFVCSLILCVSIIGSLRVCSNY